MSLESATYATQLNANNPQSSDPRSNGDDHLRLIKSVLKQELGVNNREWIYTGHSVVRRATDRFTIAATDLTSVYTSGRKVKITGDNTGTIYGEISSSTYSSSTAVNINFDSGSMSNESLTTYVGMLNPTNSIIPSAVRVGTLNDASAWGVSKVKDSYLLDSNTTEHGRYIDVRMGATSGSSAYEKDALLVIAQTADDSSTSHASGVSVFRDAVGIGARGYISSTNTRGRAWGLNAYAWKRDGGSGEIYGIEVNLVNTETGNSVPGTTTEAVGIKITTSTATTPSTACTAAIQISYGSGAGWYKGVYAETADFVNTASSSFLELNGVFRVNRLGQMAIGGEDIEGKLLVQGDDADVVLRTNAGSTSGAWVNYQEDGVRNWSFGLDEATGRMRLTTVDGVTIALAATAVLDFDENGNVGINGYQAAGGQGSVFIANAAVVPTSNPTGGGVLYAEGGALKYRGSSGTTTTIANA